MSLKVASKANQSSTFPALLLAHWVLQNESSQKSTLEIVFVEIENINDGGKSPVQLDLGSDHAVAGSESVLNTLLEQYTSIQGSSKDQVGGSYFFLSSCMLI